MVSVAKSQSFVVFRMELYFLMIEWLKIFHCWFFIWNKVKITYLFRSRVKRAATRSRCGNNGVCCIASSVLVWSESTHVADELVDIGTTIDDTASKPRDNFNISAPNWCNAVIVDGVGSGILVIETSIKKWKSLL